MSREDTIAKRQETNKKLIVEQLKQTPIVQTACEKVGVGRSTYYRWRKEDNEFAQEADEALLAGKLLVNDLAESKLMSQIRDNELSAIKFWLRNNHPRYARKLNVNANLNHQTNELSDEQKTIVRNALKLAGIKENNNHEQE
jgi:ACT domain-containing protein